MTLGRDVLAFGRHHEPTVSATTSTGGPPTATSGCATLAKLTTAIERQRALCKRYGVPWTASPAHLKVGIARNVRSGLQPLNGLRHPPHGGVTGWYLWAGEELSAAPDFFEPLHVTHLPGVCPQALPFLGLPPGWRFLVAGDHVDVWEDPKLLDV